MKRLTIFFLSLLISVFNVLLAVPARAAGENLIANPSVETSSNGSAPNDWATGGWGSNNRTLEYLNTGRTGSKSVKTAVSGYSDGDAKWYFAPVNVTAGTEYTFSDYYQSNLTTSVIAQITKGDGSNSYISLGTVPASSAWAQASFNFVAPAGAQKATVFHVVAGNGWLIVDDASLAQTVTTPPVDPPTDPTPPANNLVPNSSVEQASGGVPASWTTGGWGSNSRSHEYANGGHTGSKSLKVTISGYSDGDAKWFFTPVNVAASTTYNFSDYYKSSVASRVVAVSYDASNNPTYFAVGGTLPASTTNWAQAASTVTTLASTKKLSLFHLIEGNGWLQIDDMILSTGTTTPPVDPPADPTNLIANPSFETANGANPAAWTSNSWGANAANFSYLSTGHTGTRSAKTTVTSYTDGDAKWYFAPVNVTAGKTYNYSVWYQANTATEVVVQYTNASGGVAYAWLGDVPASVNWAEAEFSFTVPSGVVKASVFHYVASVGSLTVDDASLTTSTTPPAPAVLAPNPSVETVSPTSPSAPDKWLSSNWGTNTPTYQYVDEGHTGGKSVKVSVANYVDGDAKWYFEPQAMQRGGTYKFSAWYKTNTIPKVVAMFQKDDGTERYFGMPNPQPDANSATTWQSYSDTFIVPNDVHHVSVFFFVNSNGWVQTDDYSIVPHTLVGFNRPLVSLTFDDGFEMNTETALPIMESHGFDSTQCYATHFVEGGALADVLAFRDAGHEICSHTVSHPHLPTLLPADLQYELEHSQDVLQAATGEPVDNFASPYGEYNEAVNDVIKQFYRSHRTVDEGYNSKDNFDIYRIRVQNLNPSTTLAEFQSWLDYAKATNTWLVLVYHMVGDSNLDDFDTYTSDFAAQMNALDASDLTVKTYSDALDEVTAQL